MLLSRCRCDAPITALVAAVAEPAPRSKSAERAARWREKQKQTNPDFKQQEAERRAGERAETRAETERVGQIEEIVKANPDPLFVIGEKKVITGGDVVGNQKVKTGRVGPKGPGPDGDGKPLTGSKLFEAPPKKEVQESDDTFVEEAFKRFRSPKEVRALHRFVYEVTFKINPEPTKFRVGALSRVCIQCKWVIPATGREIYEVVFRHFWYKHPDVFQILIDRLNDRGCLEDHEGMAQRHGDGTSKLWCRRCRRLIYKPPRKGVRTDHENPNVTASVTLSR